MEPSQLKQLSQQANYSGKSLRISPGRPDFFLKPDDCSLLSDPVLTLDFGILTTLSCFLVSSEIDTGY